MARRKLPDRVICVEDRGTGQLRYRLHYVKGGCRLARGYGTAEEAEAEADRFRRLTAPLHSEALGKTIERHIADQLHRGLWRKTAKAFKWKTSTLRRFLAPLAEYPIGTVTPDAVTRCCKAWDTDERPAWPTRHNARMCAKAFFSWCVRAKLLKASPMNEDHSLRRPTMAVKRLRLDESRRLRAVIDPAAEQGEPSAVFVLCALLLGSRTTELTGLTARSLDDDGRVVVYPDAKDPGKVHEVRLPGVLIGPMALLALRAGDGPLFSTKGKWPQRWGARAVRRWAKAAGLMHAEEMDARWLRRTKDSVGIEAGLSPEVVARETGHTLQVARRHYIGAGAEATGRAANMERMTGNDSRSTVPGAAKSAK